MEALGPSSSLLSPPSLLSSSPSSSKHLKILISGATGFIGKALVRYLTIQGHDIYRLVRSKKETLQTDIFWDPYKNEIDKEKIEEIKPDAVIHLSGESVAGIWTSSKRKSILDSRVISTKFLCQTLSKLKCGPPKIFISASGMNSYYDKEEHDKTYNNPPVYDENSPFGKTGFLTEVVKEWENASIENIPSSVRLVHMRISLILGEEGILGMMLPVFRLGLGGVIGDGNQYMSWMSINDFERAVQYILTHENIKGPVNFSSPNFVTNYEFTKILGGVLFRPTLFWIPKIIVAQSWWIAGECANETVLVSLKVFPKKLLENGFEFEDTNIGRTLNKIIFKN